MTTAWGGQPPNLNDSTQTHWGASSIGILGSVMTASWTAGEHGPSPLANDSLSPGLEYRWYVDTVPAGCSIVATELGDAELTVPADGTYAWTYRLVESGVLLAPVATATATVGVGAVAVTAAVAGQAAFAVSITATGAVLATAGLTAAVAGQAAFGVAIAAAGAVVVDVGLMAAAAGLAGFTVTVLATGAASVTVSGDAVAAGRYCTQIDLVDRFGVDELVQITNPTNPDATQVDTVRVADALDDIDALIDAKLAARYALPLASVPRVLRNIACDLVRARLYEDRITEHVASREKAALRLLDDISAGKLGLGLADNGQATAPFDGPQFVTGGRVFTPASLRDYAP